MKKKYQLIANHKLIKFLVFQKNKNFNPFKFDSIFKPKRLYSDFFVCSTKIHSNFFVAENIFGLLSCDKVLVRHKLNFYSEKGRFILNKIYESNEYITKIELPKFDVDDSYISFTHECDPLNRDILKNNNIISENNFSYQHRGYSIFLNDSKSIGSIVHGNFGGIYPPNINKSAATIRNSLYSYTPVFNFKDDDEYHLVFNNPTGKKLLINICGFNKNKKQIMVKKTINSLGTEYVLIKNYEGKLSFISKLPICRCIVFKNPNSNNMNFDVFHS